MAFKQGNNPLSRKTSPMRRSPFSQQGQSMTMAELQKQAAKEDAQSKAQALELPQIEKPGADYEMDQDMSYPGGERGRDYDEEGMDDDGMSRLQGMGSEQKKAVDRKKLSDKRGMSRKASPLNDKTSRKIKKGNKTAGQIVEMQNKRSSYKKTYLGDPDDLEGEMVRTADKPASKREDRKIKKLKKTQKQLGMSRKASPLNGLNDMDGYGGDDSDTNKEETVTKQDNSRSAIKDRKAKDKAKGVSKPQMRANKAKSKSAAAAEKAKTVKNPDYKKQLEAKSERLAKRAKRKEGRADRKANNKANRQANKKSREDSKK